MKKFFFCLILLGFSAGCEPCFAVSPAVSDDWTTFSGTILFKINNQYASVIFDTNDNGICEDGDLTGATDRKSTRLNSSH